MDEIYAIDFEDLGPGRPCQVSIAKWDVLVGLPSIELRIFIRPEGSYKPHLKALKTHNLSILEVMSGSSSTEVKLKLEEVMKGKKIYHFAGKENSIIKNYLGNNLSSYNIELVNVKNEIENLKSLKEIVNILNLPHKSLHDSATDAVLTTAIIYKLLLGNEISEKAMEELTRIDNLYSRPMNKPRQRDLLLPSNPDKKFVLTGFSPVDEYKICNEFLKFNWGRASSFTVKTDFLVVPCMTYKNNKVLDAEKFGKPVYTYSELLENIKAA